MTGEAFPAKQFFEKKAKESENNRNNERRMSEYIRDFIERAEDAVEKAGIVGQSEHTITLIGTDINGEYLGYLQLPIRVRGLKKESKEKAMF